MSLEAGNKICNDSLHKQTQKWFSLNKLDRSGHNMLQKTG